jgi:hypothetical protein
MTSSAEVGFFKSALAFLRGAEKNPGLAKKDVWDPLAAAADRRIDVRRISPDPVWRTTPKWDEIPLYRYDTRDPGYCKIFSHGFRPRDYTNLDLTSGGATGFVSTAHKRELTWPGGYRYVIRAPGGIHVEPSLGMKGNSAYGGEVAFPGGIHPRYIEGAEIIDPDRYDVGTFIPNPNFAPHGVGAPEIPDPWGS